MGQSEQAFQDLKENMQISCSGTKSVLSGTSARGGESCRQKERQWCPGGGSGSNGSGGERDPTQQQEEGPPGAASRETGKRKRKREEERNLKMEINTLVAPRHLSGVHTYSPRTPCAT